MRRSDRKALARVDLVAALSEWRAATHAIAAADYVSRIQQIRLAKAEVELAVVADEWLDLLPE